MILSIIVITTIAFASLNDSLALTFSKTAPPSTITQSLAGAGSAMPMGGFQGLVNPALTATLASLSHNARAVISAGYGRDKVFDDIALPIGAVFNDASGAMGLYYRYLSGGRGRVHDVTVNFSNRVFEQVDAQGAVECGINIRYENVNWDHDIGVDESGAPIAVNARGHNLLFDLGFYQPHIYPGLDFSIVVTNVTGYGWSDAGGEKSEGWFRGRHRLLTAGLLYTLPLLGENLIFQLPIDVEFANLFAEELDNKYIVRAGLDTRIMKLVSVRFGYANAPEEPLELITEFDHKNLFYGGLGIFVKPFQIDFFAGKEEFGVTASYWF